MAEDTLENLFKEEEQEMMMEQLSVKEEPGMNNGDGLLEVKRESPYDSTTTTSIKTSNTSTPEPPSTLTPIDSVKTELIKGEVSIKMERGDSQPKLSRSTTQRVTKRTPMLFNDYPDKTEEAKKTFGVMKACSYSPKWLADSGQEDEVMSCECRPSFNGEINQACDEDSNCINRTTCMECIEDDACCGGSCQNQRFQKRNYANVSVIQTEKKGYGLRANVDIPPRTFIYEYIGEVIDEPKFRERTNKYAEEGIKHFYFMSIKKGEFIDATKKGCLARFCNHSCNPNCSVEKWVVGEKLRMGIFSSSLIRAGEELTFDYNVDRYGAEPQACFCGEPNCIGYIGGKTQTEAATKLPAIFVEALGIDDADGWRTATSKKPKRKKGEDDEDYVSSIKTRPLEKEAVQKVMGSLLQSKERWIVIRLLDRIQLTEDMAVQAEVMRIHGYQIFNSIIREWKEDLHIVYTILEILGRWPALTRNKISSSKIETTVKDLANSEDDKVKSLASALVASWSNLEMGYRIPRRARPAKTDKADSKSGSEKKDSASKESSKSNSPEPVKRASTPTGPKSSFSKPTPNSDRHSHKPHRPFQRFTNNFNAPTGPRQSRLPSGWSTAQDPSGKIYYYNVNDGRTQWDFPTTANTAPPPPPPAPGVLPVSSQKLDLQRIIDEASAKVIKRKQEAAMESNVSSSSLDTSDRKPKKMDETKAKQMLTKTFAKVVPNIVARYEKDIGGREEVKRQSKKVVEILVDKELRKKEDLTSYEMTDARKKKVKEFTKIYMGKVVAHFKKERARKAATATANGDSNEVDAATPAEPSPQDVDMPDSPKEDLSPSDSIVGTRETTTLSTPLEKLGFTPPSPKRKRMEEREILTMSDVMITPSSLEEEAFRPSKRIRSVSKTPSPRDTPEPFVTAAA